MGRFADDLKADLQDLRAAVAAWVTRPRCFFCQGNKGHLTAYRHQGQRALVCPKCQPYAERRGLLRVR